MPLITRTLSRSVKLKGVPQSKIPTVLYKMVPRPKTAVLPLETELEIVFSTGSKIRVVRPAVASLKPQKAAEPDLWDIANTPYRLPKTKQHDTYQDRNLKSVSQELKEPTKHLAQPLSSRLREASALVSVSDIAQNTSHVVAGVWTPPEVQKRGSTGKDAEEAETVVAAPLSTVLLRFQLKIDFPPYSLLELRTLMARMGKVVFLVRLHPNVAVVIFEDLEQARLAVKNTRMGRPRCRASCQWLYPTLDHPNVFAAVKHINPCTSHLLSAAAGGSPPAPSTVPGPLPKRDVKALKDPRKKQVKTI